MYIQYNIKCIIYLKKVHFMNAHFNIIWQKLKYRHIQSRVHFKDIGNDWSWGQELYAHVNAINASLPHLRFFAYFNTHM